MKLRLIVMRHATAAWGGLLTADHERELEPHGHGEAQKIARALMAFGWTPDAVISSDATRTRQTWSAMQRALAEPIPAQFTRSLYHAGLAELTSELVGGALEGETILALGHNPGWEGVLQTLTGEARTMLPATAALLELNTESWSDAITAEWQLVAMLRPHEL